ncbi:ABC transporter permease [Ktedonosporobacter rubrisoli]|uniref:ABC transporter permease n=1 Tax=Ktedonosporobacter rubrisoli TaxID=2509675 RepID=A0A4P6JS40_KTERU|nr:ABC transporter permease [Ktedonosporobacter rubrisoli]QBD78135.1 ABC transporter permease [Ktedonosporobacter rubrisoli]
MSLDEGFQPANELAQITQARPGQASFATVLRSIWQIVTINKKIAIGCAIVAFFVLLAIVGPFMLPYNPMALSQTVKAPPSAAHWLGTANSGQDVFSQLLYGTRSSVFWGFLTGLSVMVVSIVIGLVGGYLGGIVDELLTLLTNIFLLIPSLALAIIAVAYFPRTPLTIATVIISTHWCFNARVLRAQTLSMRSREFVTAARSTGESIWRIIFSEIFPNEIGIVAASFVSTVIFAILAWAALEFLGLGDPNSVSWGSMLYWANQAGAIFGGEWWWFLPPGLCIALLGVGLTLINIGIDEVIDPRLRNDQ